MRLIHYFLCLSLLASAGCKKNAAMSEEREARNPLVKKALAHVDNQEWDQAESTFKDAILEDARMSTPYLNLGMIYHEHKPDYINAIYCYKRYLELRPDSEKTEFVNEQIEAVQIALGNAILKQSGALKMFEQYKQLKEDYERMKRQLIRLSSQNAGTPTPAPTQNTSSFTAQQQQPKPRLAPTSTSTGQHKIYHVAAGDTLSKISSKFYGDTSHWRAIYEANSDRMKNAGDLRVGQTLVIPAID